jgi:hypothetical protein
LVVIGLFGPSWHVDCTGANILPMKVEVKLGLAMIWLAVGSTCHFSPCL